MKKSLCLLFFILILVGLTGCENNIIDEAEEEQRPELIGRVLVYSNSDNTYNHLIYVTDGHENIIGYVIAMENRTENENIFENLETGDKIKITGGSIMQTYPAKMGVYTCELIERGSPENIPQDIHDSLTELGWIYGDDILTADIFAVGKDIFLNPAVDASARIEAFISTLFRDPKIVFFDNFDNMSEELQRFIFMVGVYKGIVHKNTGIIGEGLTKEMIEANIQAVFGSDVISKLDYDYICAEYNEERGIYEPQVYGAPQYSLEYIFYSIENIGGNVYKAVISYIDRNGGLLSFDTDGERLLPPEHIRELESQADSLLPEDYIEKRKEAIEEFKAEIKNNPEKYERTELYLEAGGDYIHLLSAKLYTNDNIDELVD